MLFLAIQQELDCITDDGRVLGKICYDDTAGCHVFHPADVHLAVTESERVSISERLSGLDSGKYSIPMQDDD